MHLKLLIFFLLFRVAVATCADAMVVLDKDELQKQRDTSLSIDSLVPVVADASTLKEHSLNSTKRYKIFYTLSTTCGASHYLFPLIVDYTNQHLSSFELYAISGEREDMIPIVEKYLGAIGYSKHVYFLNKEQYGNGRNPYKRVRKLIATLCKECDRKRMAASSFFVLDKNNNVVAHTNWNYTAEEKYQLLVSLPLD
jgi:hypothetical protein